MLQQQTLDARSEESISLARRTVFQVIRTSATWPTPRTPKVQAMANYTHARIALDQALGTTLEVNNVSIDEALAGRISRPSQLPAELPAASAPTAMTMRTAIAHRACAALFAGPLPWAQQRAIEPIRPSAPMVMRPYLATEVPPVRLTQFGRLGDLVRAGILYLTRRTPSRWHWRTTSISKWHATIRSTSRWQIERSQAGGALPGVPSGASQAGPWPADKEWRAARPRPA